MKFRHFIFAAAVSSIALASCQKNITSDVPAEKQDTYTVHLACAGELDVTHQPLTKASPDDLYGIQVYYAPVSGGSYQHYAYGLFDDVSDVSLELIADYKYKFVIDMIVDGKNVVYSSNMNELEDEEVLLGYGAPFKTIDYTSGSYKNTLTSVTNALIISSSDEKYFDRLGYEIQLLDGNTYGYPKGVDVYYGRLSDYVPSEDGATIAIHMKHMIYGLKVVADDFLTQGTVTGQFAYRLDYSYHYQDRFTLTAPDNKEYEAVYAYTNRDDWYDKEIQNDAYVTSYIKFTWDKDENTSLTLDQQSIKMIRMKQTVVNVTFFEDESAGNTKVSMVFDDLEMSENEQTYTFGDDQEEYEW